MNEIFGFLGLGFAFIIFLAFCLFQYLHKRERGELNDRVMAKHLQEFQYYRAKYHEDIAEVRKLRKEARGERTVVRKKGEELIEKEFEEDKGETGVKKPEFEEYEESEIIPEE